LNNLIYISDFFLDQFQGGAELSDSVMIDHLCGHLEVSRRNSSEFKNKRDIANKYIISNFSLLPQVEKDFFVKSGVDYIIIERDQKYVRSRNTATYPNFIAPPSEIVNREFYSSARKVFCLTSKQMEIMNAHLDLKNVESLGCTQFSKEQIDILSNNIDNKKIKKYAIVRSKMWKKAIAFCKSKNIEYDVIEKQEYSRFIKTLSEYHGLVFFSHAFESCCRLLVEARILNLSIITDNRNGCTYEDWFAKSKGRDLLRDVEKITKNGMNLVLGECLDN